jgi:poly-beta-hydroxyalkanoate depolymerase
MPIGITFIGIKECLKCKPLIIFDVMNLYLLYFKVPIIYSMMFNTLYQQHHKENPFVIRVNGMCGHYTALIQPTE